MKKKPILLNCSIGFYYIFIYYILITKIKQNKIMKTIKEVSKLFYDAIVITSYYIALASVALILSHLG